MRKLQKAAKRWEQQVHVGAVRKLRGMALAADAAVVTETPVDTGRARSNWQVNIGAPAQGILEEVQTAEETVERARSELSRYSDIQQPIHLTNNLPYIKRLNEGWSLKAPAGYVETAVLTALQHAAKTKVFE